MNKIYRTVYNETTNTWVAVEETAKSHRKSSSGVVDNATAGVSGSLKVRSLTAIAAALAMVSPFMANQAQADVLCKNGDQVFARASCEHGETPISTISWSGGTTNGTNTTAWGSGYAGAVQNTDTVNYTISSNNYPADENGNRPTFTITETVKGNGANATAWGGGRAIGPNATAMANGKAYGSSSLAVGNGAIAYGPNSIAFGRGKAIGSDSIAFGQSTALGANSFANGSSKTIAIGSNSVAYGESTIAEGNNAMTWGFGTRTADNNATAFGKFTVASGERATAFGMQTKALGENSVAAGGLDNVVNAKNAAALGGQNAVVSGLNSVTLGGDGSQALASNSLAAVGGVVSAGAENAIAVGNNAQVKQKDSVAIGTKTIADGVGAVAIGGSEPMDNNNNILDGGAKAIGVGAVAIGQFAEAQKTQGVAVGDGAKAQGSQSTAIGANSIASGAAGIAIGGDDIGRRNANGTLNNSDWGNTHTQLQALQTELTNNGYSASTVINNVVTAGSTNAFADITTAQGDVSMALGQKALAQGHLSNAVGALSKTVGNNSIAFGTASQTGADNSIAMGSVATTGAGATQSTAIGYMAQTGGTVDVAKVDSVAGMTYSVNGGDTKNVTDLSPQSGTGKNSVAIGEHNKVLGENSTAVGQGNIVLAKNAGAFGDPNVVTADAIGSYAIGNNNVIGSANAYALGSNITATAKNSVFLGDSAAYVQAGTLTADNAGSTAGTTAYSSNLKDIKNTAGKTVIDSGDLTFEGSTPAGVVSVGAKNKERRIQNVAAGLIDENSTDAINGSQLYSALHNLDTSINTDNRNVGLATIDGTQTIVSPYLDMSGLNGEEIQKATAEKAQYEIDLAAWKKANQSATPEQIAAKQQELLSATTYLQHFAQSTGQHAVAMGYGSKAQGDNSVAFMGNTAQGTNAMVWGGNANAGNVANDYVSDIRSYQANGWSQPRDVKEWSSWVEGGERVYKMTLVHPSTGDEQELIKKLADLQNYADFSMASATSAKNTTAFGQQTVAMGDNATAYGANTLASGQNATAFGLGTIAGNFTDKYGKKVVIVPKDGVYDVLDEQGNTIYSNIKTIETLLADHKIIAVSNGNNQDNQVAWGEKTFASGKNATAFGFKTQSTAENSTAWGHKTSATNNRATAFGIDTEASGRNSTAFGNITHATNENATAWGSNTQATGIGSTAWGSYTVAGGDNSTAWGNKSVVGSGSFAIQKMDQNGDPMFDPNGNPVNDNYTNLSIQFDSTNEMYYVQAVDEQGKTVTLAGDKSKYPNALIEPQNEDWTRPAGADEQEVRLRVKNWIANNGGTNAGDYSTAFGNGSKVYAENALGALGGIVHTDATNSAAIGEGATVDSKNSYAIGANTVVNESANNSFATTGGEVSVSAENAIALGGKVEQQSAVAIGKGSNAKHQDSVALGSGSQTIDGVQAETGTVGTVEYGGNWAGVLADTNKVVSVGGRQIQNVAAGQVTSKSTDAINGSQLYQAYEQLQWKASVSAANGGTVTNTNDAVTQQVIGDYNGSKNKGIVNFKAGKGIEIETANSGSLDMTFKVAQSKITATNGSAVAGNTTTDDGSNFVTAIDVANTINDVYWTAKDGGDGSAGSEKSTNVKASNTVTFKPAGTEKNIQVALTPDATNGGGVFEFSLKSGNPLTNDATNKGKVTAGNNTGDILNAGQVADAINSAYWRVIGAGNNAGSTAFAEKSVQAGDLVTLKADKGLKLNQAERTFTFENAWTVTTNANGDTVINDGTTNHTIAKNTDSVTKVTSENKAPVAGASGALGDYTDGNIQVAVKRDDQTDTDTFDVKLNKDVTLGNTGNNNSGSLNVKGDDGNTEIKPNVINFTDGNQNNTGSITGLAGNLDYNNHNQTTTPVSYTYPTDNSVNNAATLGDVLNAGWNLKVGGVQRDFVTHGDTVSFVKGTGTTVDYKNGDISYSVNKSQNGITPDNDGKYDTTNIAGDTYLDQKQVAEAINNAAWRAKTNGTTKNLNNTSNQKITAGDLVEFNQGNGVRIAQDAGKFEFSANVANVTTDSKGNITQITYYDTTQNKYVTANIAQDGNTVTTLTANNGEPANKTTGNITLTQTGDNYDVALNNDVKLGDDKGSGSLNVSDQTNGTNPVANTEIKPNVINFTDGNQNNTGSITGLGSHLADASTATKMPDASNPSNFANKQNEAATLGDVLNAGWNLQNNNSPVDFVTHGDTVNFVNGKYTTVSVTPNAQTGANDIKVDVNLKGGKSIQITDDGTINYTGKDSDTVTSVVAGDNITVTPNMTDPSKPEYKVALNKDVTLDKGSITITGDTNTVNITGDNVDMGGNQIHNVAAGEAPTDAVNVGQLQDVVGNVSRNTVKQGDTIGDSTVLVQGDVVVSKNDPTATLKTYNVYGQTEYLTNDVVQAVSKMNEQGIKFFHTNDGKVQPEAQAQNAVDASASGAYSTAIGYQAKAEANNALAIGNGAKATGVNAISIGAGNEVTGSQSIAVGTNLTVNGNNSGAFGDPTEINGSDSYSVGNGNKIATNNTFALGNQITQTTANSVFLGDEAAYTAAGASTAGTGEYAANHEDIKDVNGNVVIAKDELKFAGSHEDTGVVSVGDVGAERRIQNVAPGKLSAESTDAINGSQLYSVAQKVGQVTSGGAGIVQYSNPDAPTTPNGGVATNDVTLVGADAAAPVTIHNVAPGVHPTDAVNVGQLNQAVGDIHNRIGDVSKHADASAASAIAVASMPQAFLPGKNLVAVGGGTYHGQTGYAIGVSTISDNGHWIVKGTATGNSKNRYGAGIGAGYQW